MITPRSQQGWPWRDQPADAYSVPAHATIIGRNAEDYTVCPRSLRSVLYYARVTNSLIPKTLERRGGSQRNELLQSLAGYVISLQYILAINR